MATKNDDLGRRVDLLNDTGSADRAKRINSLHRTVSDLERQSNEKKMDYSKEINSLTNEQRRMLHKLEAERDSFTTDTMESYNTVVKGLGTTINRLATGIKYITTETAKATKDAIGQYASAVGQDISINKQNTVAMALSTASPLFGYFASKFMETDVFKNAAARIREKVGDAVSGGFSGVGRMLGFKKKYDDDVPSMQRGGYVKKGGMIKVHAAEVVMPAEKVMQQIDKAKNTAIARQMGTTMGDMSQTLEDIQEEVAETQEKTGNILTTFMQEYNAVGAEQSEVGNTLQHVVAELKEIKQEMFGSADSWGLVLERTLNKHPFFKGMYRVYKFFDSTLPGAFKWLFGKRSTYSSHVAAASRSKNVYDRIVGVTGLLYTGMMPKFDELIKYVKELTEFTTGKETKAPKEELEKSRFERMAEWFSKEKDKKKKGGLLKSIFGFESVIEKAEADTEEGIGIKEQLEKAGIKGWKDLLHPRKALQTYGIKKEDIEEKLGKAGTYVSGAKAFKDIPKDAKDFIKSSFKQMLEFLEKIAKAETDREEREGPHSPSMADNIASTAEIAKEESKREKTRSEKQLEALNKVHKSVKGVGERINQLAKDTIKKMGSALWTLLMFLPNILGTVLSTAFSGLKGLFGGIFDTLLTLIPGRRLLGRGLYRMGAKDTGKKLIRSTKKKSLTKMAKEASGDIGKAKGPQATARAAGKGAGKIGATAFGRGVSSVGGAAKRVGGALMPGIKSTAKFGGKLALGGAKLAGRFVAAPLFAALELGGSLYDAISAMINPEEFGASRMASGIGAFFGGKDSGWSGAASGAMKWGTIGAGIGTMLFPGVGTAIGGGLGGLLGGIAGFVGGHNMAKGIDWMLDGVKSILSGAWEVFKFPFQAFWELIKSFWVLLKFGWKNTIGKAYSAVTQWFTDWWEGDGPVKEFISDTATFFGDLWGWYKEKWMDLFGVVGKVWDAISNFAVKAKEFLIDKLSALGPIWNWIKEWIVEPAKTGITAIREGRVADDLEAFLNEENPVREMGDPKKQLMSEIAQASAEAHRANSEATLRAMKDAAEETTKAISKSSEEQKEGTKETNTAITQVWKNFNSVQSSNRGSAGTVGSGSRYSEQAMFGLL